MRQIPGFRKYVIEAHRLFAYHHLGGHGKTNLPARRYHLLRKWFLGLSVVFPGRTMFQVCDRALLSLPVLQLAPGPVSSVNRGDAEIR